MNFLYIFSLVRTELNGCVCSRALYVCCMCMCRSVFVFVSKFFLLHPNKVVLNVTATATGIDTQGKNSHNKTSKFSGVDFRLCVYYTRIYASMCTNHHDFFYVQTSKHTHTFARNLTYLCTHSYIENMQRSNRIKECMPYHTFMAREREWKSSKQA